MPVVQRTFLLHCVQNHFDWVKHRASSRWEKNYDLKRPFRNHSGRHVISAARYFEMCLVHPISAANWSKVTITQPQSPHKHVCSVRRRALSGTCMPNFLRQGRGNEVLGSFSVTSNAFVPRELAFKAALWGNNVSLAHFGKQYRGSKVINVAMRNVFVL